MTLGQDEINESIDSQIDKNDVFIQEQEIELKIPKDIDKKPKELKERNKINLEKIREKKRKQRYELLRSRRRKNKPKSKNE